MSRTSKSNVSDTSTLFFPDLLSAQNRVLLKAGPWPRGPQPVTGILYFADWTGLDWTGLVKRGLVKRGLKICKTRTQNL